MLPENESEPFLEDSDAESNRDLRRKSALERQRTKGHLGAFWHWISLSSPFLSHFLVFVATSLLWGSVILVMMNCSPQIPRTVEVLEHSQIHGNLTSEAKLLTCGHSTPEAKKLGCQYDILSNHWVPGICMDQEAVKEYQTDGSWYGFADENRTELLTIEAMSEMDFYYTSERDHIIHCAMLWRKQFRAFFEGRRNLDSIIASGHHTEHCSQFLVDMSDNGPDYRNMPIKTHVGYAGCWVKE